MRRLRWWNTCLHVAGRMWNGTTILEKNFAEYLQLNITYLSYDLVILLLGNYPRQIKTYAHTKICAWKFIAALFTATTKISIIGWMNRQMIHMIVSSSAERNKLLLHTTSQMNLKIIVLTKKEKNKTQIYLTSFLWNSSFYVNL